ncbi:protein mab-21-like 4 isoform X1 [Heteronotia binoei]|uniref:protein mab-21-like 4 isoform X1 n=1 Tax=Heteronotia binoei TaxID=13085 RepID=UPI00292E9D19|nr:protein mab-21-like 4 isoform X1 [Heteronotia binoei]
MAAKVPQWQNYLQVIKSREAQRVECFQKAENILLIVLERVNAMDPRFIVEYSRNLEALEFALCATEDEITMEVPLCMDADDLLVQECSGEQSDSEKVTHGNYQMPGSCYLAVPKEGNRLEKWTKEDVFSMVGSTESKGHILPGKILQLLKDLIVAAIVYCKRQFLIKPGELSAERLKEDDMQLPLLISSGWKMICFNIVPVARRKQNALKFNDNWRERGFPQGSLWKVTQEADYIPASYYHWRYSTSRPILKLLQIISTRKGYCLDSLCLLEQVNHEYWREEGKSKGLTFHHLKMVLLWATHFFSSPEDWVNLEGSVYRLLVILLCCLVINHLPHFLYPEQNLFQGEDADLSSLYSKVESFANNPKYFLKFHFSGTEYKMHHQTDIGFKALLRLPAEDKAYWDTAFFDMLLNKFQMYEITDTQRVSAMSSILSKTKKVVTNQS